MSGRRRRDGDAPAPGSFADSMRDVAPLRGRDRVRTPPAPEPQTDAPAGSARQQRAAPRVAPRTLIVERRGDDAEGRVDDVSRALLARLRRRRPPPDREVDLHGLSARQARRALRAALEDARAGGERCLLVIHGRGTRSRGEPVLKRSLPEWLAAPECAAHLLAFCTAPPRLGGPGASLVWLRRGDG